MNQVIRPHIYIGSLSAPASKSYLQRAIAIASLSAEPCQISNYYPSKDAIAALHIAQTIGATTKLERDILQITGKPFSQTNIDLHCGEAGLSARMFSPIAAILSDNVNITGEGSLLNRPMPMLVDALTRLGVSVAHRDHFLPITTTGKLKAGHICIDGSESSQVLTGLLIALPMLEEDSVIEVKNLKSKPYIQMTLDILADFGIKITHKRHQIFYIKGKQRPAATHYIVEGDWSGAAFHLVGAAINGAIKLNHINTHSSQADKAILEALRACGASVSVSNHTVSVMKKDLNAFEFDATDCPDLFPPLAVLAAACQGTSVLRGTHRLIHKESNRALTLQSEMAKLGVNITLSDDRMLIQGGKVHGGTVDSQNDHRIAMAMAIIGLISETPITITHAEAVEKSYPSFFDDFRKLQCVK